MRPPKQLLYGLLSLLWLAGCHRASAQGSGKVADTENKVHSILIYNFTKYINWPEEYNRGDFVIGVVGETDLTEELQRMAREKSLATRKLIVKKYTDVKDITGKVHILFIPTTSSGMLSNALQRLRGQPTLIITHKDGLGRAGSLINFVSVNGKYRFELNLTALEQQRLKCAQQLKTLGIVI